MLNVCIHAFSYFIYIRAHGIYEIFVSNPPQLDKGIRKCGHCVSGLTIVAAKNRLQRLSDTKIILNVGSVDILHGHDIVDMKHQYDELVAVCKQQRIDLTITTLPPLANQCHNEIVRRGIAEFNKFLLGYANTPNVRVIDIEEVMVDIRGKILFACYQP